MKNIPPTLFNGGAKIPVGIVGGAGYTGGELLRILLNHPQVEIAFVHSNSQTGKLVSSVHQDLVGETDLRFGSWFGPSAIAQDKLGAFAPAHHDNVAPCHGEQLAGQRESAGLQASPNHDSTDCHGEQLEIGSDSERSTVSPNHDPIVFLCLGHGEARKFLEANPLSETVRVIDLSNDFRLSGKNTFGERKFMYGLPELNRDAIRTAHNIANPGCFATAIQLGLLPLAQAGLLGEVHTTGITGSTGAGQSLSATSHFSWRVSNIQPYKTLTHQHLGEIVQSLQQLQPDYEGSSRLHFVPWRGDFSRGIFVSSVVEINLSLDEITALYQAFFLDHPFTHLVTEPLHLKMVTNTNKCLIQLEKDGNQLVIHSAIDNLLKGACGQAVQNMNLMAGLPEDTGLRLKGNGF